MKWWQELLIASVVVLGAMAFGYAHGYNVATTQCLMRIIRNG